MASEPARMEIADVTGCPSSIRALAWVGSSRQPIRRLPDPFAIGGQVSEGTCSTPESFQIARSLSTVIGPRHPVVERYWEKFSWAPQNHLRAFGDSGGAIVFARTITDALTHAKVNERRGRSLTKDDAAWYREQELIQAGVYEPTSHTLALPTHYRALELEEIAMHELGHALTYRQAAKWAADRPDLLIDLPPLIAAHVFHAEYATPCDDRKTTYTRVLEAIADGYLWLIAGRARELSPALCEAVFAALDA